MKKKQKNKISAIKVASLIFSISVLCFAFINLAIADWNTPTAAPPGNNAPAPLNVSTNYQTKTGPLILNTDNYPTGLIVAAGNVGIGTTSPDSPLMIQAPAVTYNQSGYEGALRIQIAGTNKRIFMGYDSGNFGYIAASDFSTPANLVLNGNGGSVGIGTTPEVTFDVNSRSSNNTARFLAGAANFSTSIQIGRTGTESSWAIAPGNGLWSNQATAGDTIIRTESTSKRLLLGTGENTTMAIDNGKVGIGTTSPGQTLTVEGSLGILGGSSFHTIFQGGDQSANITYALPSSQGTLGQVLTNNGLGNLSWSTVSGGGLSGGATNYIPIWASATSLSSSVIYQTGGEVGIGTTTPGAKLEINDNDSNTTTSGLKFTNFSCTGTDKLTVGSNGLVICSPDQTGSGTGNIVDSIYATLGAPNVSPTYSAGDAGGRGIVNLGSVGIGTAAPDSGLVLEKDNNGGLGADLSLVNKSTGTGDNSAVAIDFGVDNTTYANGAGNAQIKVFQDGISGRSGAITFSTWNGSAFGERVRIRSDGLVGIGTASPAEKLDVAGNINVSAASGEIDHESNNPFYINSDDKLQLRINADGSGTSNFQINNAANDTVFAITDAGSVGIGTTSPGTNKLEIDGGTTYTKGGLIIETRTSDPSSPETGRMWLITP